MAWAYSYYNKDTAPAFTAPEGSRVGDVERMIYALESQYAKQQLAKIMATADTRLDPAKTAAALEGIAKNLAAFDAQKAPLVAALDKLKTQGVPK